MTDTTTLRSSRRQWLLAGIIAILGGYLTILSIGGQLIQTLLGYLTGAGVELAVLLISQLVFAVAVTVLGYLLAPAQLGRRLLAAVIYVAGAAVLVLSLYVRISGALGNLGGIPVAMTIANPYFMVVLCGGLGWLIATSARPIAYLSLVLAFLVMPLGYLFAINGIASALSSLIQLVVSAVAALVILAVSRPRVDDAAIEDDDDEVVEIVEVEEPAAH